MTEEMGGKICVAHILCAKQIFKKKQGCVTLFFFGFFLVFFKRLLFRLPQPIHRTKPLALSEGKDATCNNGICANP